MNVVADPYPAENFCPCPSVKMIANNWPVAAPLTLSNQIGQSQGAVVPDDRRADHRALRMIS